jgi:hypothetical protein
MKAITLQQPWATLAVIGAKTFETRGWNTNHRGRILIHAGKSKEMGIEVIDLPPFKKFIPVFHALPFGAIIGEASISYTVQTENIRSKLLGTDELVFGDYKTGRWAFKLTNPIAYKSAIPCRGQLSLWDCPDEILQQLKIERHGHR